MLIKPFQATVDSGGQALVIVGHSIQGIEWRICQLGFALGQLAPSPQVAAHINSMPLCATTTMQTSLFGNLDGSPPYAMESFMVGPPYPILSAGDQIVCAVVGATANDQFTVGAFVEELVAGTGASMVG